LFLEKLFKGVGEKRRDLRRQRMYSAYVEHDYRLKKQETGKRYVVLQSLTPFFPNTGGQATRAKVYDASYSQYLPSNNGPY